MSKITQGRRIYLNDDGTYPHLQPGDYCKQNDGSWMTCVPSGILGCIKTHTVIEHEDKTITVSPSILTHGHSHSPGEKCLDPESCHPNWHGFLEKGIWREC